MIMSDGVRPSNVGRGYVLRRLLRRTIQAMRVLGVTEPVIPHLLPRLQGRDGRQLPGARKDVP